MVEKEKSNTIPKSETTSTPYSLIRKDKVEVGFPWLDERRDADLQQIQYHPNLSSDQFKKLDRDWKTAVKDAERRGVNIFSEGSNIMILDPDRDSEDSLLRCRMTAYKYLHLARSGHPYLEDFRVKPVTVSGLALYTDPESEEISVMLHKREKVATTVGRYSLPAGFVDVTDFANVVMSSPFVYGALRELVEERPFNSHDIKNRNDLFNIDSARVFGVIETDYVCEVVSLLPLQPEALNNWGKQAELTEASHEILLPLNKKSIKDFINTNKVVDTTQVSLEYLSENLDEVFNYFSLR